MLLVENLRFHHPGGGFSLALPSLTMQAGDSLAVLGPSGCGKTTLLRLLVGLLSVQEGRVALAGEVLGSMSSEALRAFRLRRVGLVFQDFALLDHLTVAENLLLPARFMGLEISAAESRAHDLAERLEVAALWRRPAARLSQGERQRVAVARALVHRPDFVFADEPTASLDADRSGRVMRLLLRECAENGGVLVTVTHDANAAAVLPRHFKLGDLSV